MNPAVVEALPLDPAQELLLQAIQLLPALVILALSWFVGYRVLHHWEIRKKAGELDLEAERLFQQLHGEYKALWRMWKMHHKPNPESPTATTEAIWEMASRVAMLEGRLEALLFQLAASRNLDAQQLRDLGMLRQVVQQLREGMKQGSKLDEEYRGSDYRAFHDLSASLLAMLRMKSVKLTDRQTRSNMQAILAVRVGDLQDLRKQPEKV